MAGIMDGIKEIVLTSNFARLRSIAQNPQLYPVSIARYAPRGVDVPAYPDLAPAAHLVGKSVNPMQYVKEYTRQLANAPVDAILMELLEMSEGRVPVLLCYESPDPVLITKIHRAKKLSEVAELMQAHRRHFCHRHLVSRWLSYYNFPASEFSSAHSITPQLQANV